MRMRWRGLELPSRVVRDDAVSTGTYGRFVIEPFEQGLGTTIGNSLRRVLLSSLAGAAVTSVKIEGVSHEFRSIEGVLEDVTDIVLNIKGIILKLTGAERKTMTVRRDSVGEVRAGDIVTDPAVEIANPDHLIATLTADVPFELEMSVSTGRGYATVADNRSAEQVLDVIPIDSVFSPVLRVRYRTEDMRVGQRTNYDRLILEVWTKGTVLPEDALVEAGMILRKHLNPFVMYDELGKDGVQAPRPIVEDISTEVTAMAELLAQPVTVLKLSARANNCLEAARVASLHELVTKTEADLLRFRSFGKTSLHEVQRKLVEMGLSLGMRIDNDAEGGVAPRLEGQTGGDELSGDEPGDPPGSPGSPEIGPMEVFTMGD